MRRRLIAASLLLLSACATYKEPIMPNNATIQVLASCRNNPGCTFNGEDIFLDVNITNAGSRKVSLPLEFIRKRGPTIKVVDVASEREVFLKPNLADPALLARTATLRPGESASVEWVITEFEMTQFHSKKVDISVEVSIGTTAMIGGERVDLAGSDTLRITELVTQ